MPSGSSGAQMGKTYRETESGSTGAVSTQPVLAWKVHLVREEPAKLFLVGPVVLAGLLVSYLIFQSLLFTAAALFLVVSSLAEFLFPIRYEIDRRGVSSRTLLSRTFIEWDRVKKYYLDDCGIKLSPLVRPGRLEAYRGVYLRFGSRRDEVIEAVRRMRDVGRAGGAGG